MHHSQRHVAGDIGDVRTGVVDRLDLLKHPHSRVQGADVVDGPAVGHVLYGGPHVGTHQFALEGAVGSYGHRNSIHHDVTLGGYLHPLVAATVYTLQLR